MANEVFSVFARPRLIENICHEAAAGSVCRSPLLKPAKDHDEAAERVREEVGTLLGCEWFADTADDLIELLVRLNDPGLRQWLATEARRAVEVRKRSASTVLRAAGAAPPTEKQIKFLVRLGVRDFSGSKAEASALIDSLLKERG